MRKGAVPYKRRWIVMFYFSFKVDGEFDSKEVWEILEPLKINMLVLDDEVYVYGRATPNRIAIALRVCEIYGKVKGDFYSTDDSPEGR